MKTITPHGDYVKYPAAPSMLPLTAHLERSGGTWWLVYEDGSQTNLHHQANGKGAFKRDQIERMVTGKKFNP